MDFKVAGTETGVTADGYQIQGITEQIMDSALDQARSTASYLGRDE